MLVEQSRPGCMSLLLVWVASAFSVYLTSLLVPGMTISSFGTALGVAVVLGLLNALVRPVLVLLTLPVTIVTLGLFLLVINAGILGLSAWLLSGFAISGFFSAFFGAIVLTFVSGLISYLLESFSRPAKES